jgi:hypothetical protein
MIKLGRLSLEIWVLHVIKLTFFTSGKEIPALASLDVTVERKTFI